MSKKDISNEIEFKNGRAGLGWSQNEVWYKNKRIGWLESGAFMNFEDGYSYEEKEEGINTRGIIYKHSTRGKNVKFSKTR